MAAGAHSGGAAGRLRGNAASEQVDGALRQAGAQPAGSADDAESDRLPAERGCRERA
ncbi:hypothetical protein D3C86_2237290 [compost metagenome]